MRSTQEFAYLLGELKLVPAQAVRIELREDALREFRGVTMYHDMWGSPRLQEIKEFAATRDITLKHYSELVSEEAIDAASYRRGAGRSLATVEIDEKALALASEGDRKDIEQYLNKAEDVRVDKNEMARTVKVSLPADKADGLRKLIAELSDFGQKVDYSPIPPAKPHMILLAGSAKEAKEVAEALGVTYDYVKGFMDMRNYKGKTIYLVGGALDRPDFPAIEGLFIQFNIKVVDLEADAQDA